MAITFGVNLSVDNYWDVPEFVWWAEDLDSPAANTPTVTSTHPLWFPDVRCLSNKKSPLKREDFLLLGLATEQLLVNLAAS